ncbi:MAG: SBBP repeat-containing protein, partial [Planctomycetota bacterium]
AIVKLSADGSELLFGTLLGGSSWDGLMGIHVDGRGDIYVAGHTQSVDFPVTPGAPQRGFAAKSDCFLARLSSDGSMVYSTYLGGRENEFAEHRPWLGVDGTLLLTGVTSSPDFPTTAGALQRTLNGKNDGFITKVAADGKSFVFSTLLGGSSGGEFYLMPTLDHDGNIFVVGHSTSTDFPVTSNALQSALRGGRTPQDGDGILAVLSPDGSRLLYATYLGGNRDDLIRSVALGPSGEVYLVGSTASTDFPVTSHAVQRKLAGSADAFVVKLVPKRK